MGAGGDPTQILCSPGQARVLSCEYKNQLQILRSDDRRGAYVAVVVNEINGRGMTIMADPDVPDTDVWVLDPAGFGLSSLNGRAITDTDATPKGFDGIKRMALGELTFSACYYGSFPYGSALCYYVGIDGKRGYVPASACSVVSYPENTEHTETEEDPAPNPSVSAGAGAVSVVLICALAVAGVGALYFLFRPVHTKKIADPFGEDAEDAY